MEPNQKPQRKTLIAATFAVGALLLAGALAFCLLSATLPPDLDNVETSYTPPVCNLPSWQPNPYDVRILPIRVGGSARSVEIENITAVLRQTYQGMTFLASPAWLHADTMADAVNATLYLRGGGSENVMVLILTDSFINDPTSGQGYAFDGWGCQNFVILRNGTGCMDGLVIHEVGHILGLRHEDGGWMANICESTPPTDYRARLAEQPWAKAANWKA